MYQQPHARGYPVASMAAILNSSCLVFAVDHQWLHVAFFFVFVQYTAGCLIQGTI